MTRVDALVDSAGRQIDDLFAKQQDDQMLRMIACGVEEDLALDILEQRAEQYAAWRPSVLADIRLALVTNTPMKALVNVLIEG